jgi:hypothetical protein
MRQRFYLYRRRGTYYLQDARTGKQQSLETKDRITASRLLEIKRQTTADPAYNQFILRACLATQDPLLPKRTWQTVMDQIQTHGKESSKRRYVRAMKAKAYDRLRQVKLVETSAEDFLSILNGGKVSVAHYLKRLHNLALGLGWLAFPILAPRLWPKLHFKPKRAITLAEHQRILAAEKHPERNLYYQLLWEVGASQSYAAMLTAKNIDRKSNTLFYSRLKTGEQAELSISRSLAAILERLPKTGPMFPTIFASKANIRASDFYYRCKQLKIEGVTLHSYRYAWAERAKTCGYPERFAQEALGHNSKAVHRAYARRARVVIPALEDFEKGNGMTPIVMPPAA